MTQRSSSLIGRSDTMLGVCQAIGEDFGFNPNWLRVAFALAVVWNIEYALAAYLAVGVVVAATRLIHRSPRKVQAAEPVAQTVEATPAAAEPVLANEPLAIAA